jgi:transposase-like protein
MPRSRKSASPFRYFNSSPEVIRLVVMMYVRFPLSLRNVEDLLFERGIDICHETVPMWWNRFGPMLTGDIRRQRISRYCQLTRIWFVRTVTGRDLEPDPVPHREHTQVVR